MLCPTCQHNNVDGAPFCAECGTRLNQAPTMPSPATGTLPQQTVLQDRYVVTQKLGQGGMGAVYRASDRRLSSVTWAVKELSQSALSGPLERQQARDAFRHEAEMLAALNHPNLPRVTDHFEQDGKAYLVMEYALGVLLHQLLTGYDPTRSPFRLPPAGQVNPNLPQQLSDTISAATDSDLNRRFPSIAAFRGALFDMNGQANAQVDSQPFQQSQAANMSYARPNSEPFMQPGSQPFAASSVAAQTTMLANISRWIGAPALR